MLVNDRVLVSQPPQEPVQDVVFKGLRVFAALTSELVREHVARVIGEIDGVELEVTCEDGASLRAAMARSDMPDALLIETATSEIAAAALKQIRERLDGAPLYICVLTRFPTRAAVISLLREGANDVLSITPSVDELSACLARAGSVRELARAASSNTEVRTIVFLHASGGAGATTIAVNSAVHLQALAAAGNERACLLDMDHQFGTTDLHLDLPVRSQLVDLIKAPERLDRQMFEDLMLNGPGGLRILSAPDIPLPLDALPSRTVESILSIARRQYRYVVIDMPVALTNWTEAVMRHADHVVLVTQINVVALRTARRLLEALREEDVPRAPITIVANRYPAKTGGEHVSIGKAEKALGMPIRAEVPGDYPLVLESQDRGVPAIVLRPRSKFAAAVTSMLADVTGRALVSGKRSGLRLFKLGR
jgi:pilus assembly protein CpaE